VDVHEEIYKLPSWLAKGPSLKRSLAKLGYQLNNWSRSFLSSAVQPSFGWDLTRQKLKLSPAKTAINGSQCPRLSIRIYIVWKEAGERSDDAASLSLSNRLMLVAMKTGHRTFQIYSNMAQIYVIFSRITTSRRSGIGHEESS